MLFVVQSTNSHTERWDFHSGFLFKEREETLTTMCGIAVPIFCPREPLSEVLCLPSEGSFICTISERSFIRVISALTVLTPVTHSWPHGSAKGFSLVFFHSCNQLRWSLRNPSFQSPPVAIKETVPTGRCPFSVILKHRLYSVLNHNILSCILSFSDRIWH